MDRVECVTVTTTLLFHPAAEDSLNMAMRDITVTARDGRVSQLEQVYIRGSMVSCTAAVDWEA